MTAPSARHHRVRRANAALAAFVLLAAAGCAGESSDASPEEGESALDGVAFTDPGGRYTLTVPADWEARHGIAGEGIEVWIVAEADATFTPNVNVMTEDVTGMSLGTYLDLSITNAPSIISDFELLRSDPVTGSAGQELAVMEYSGLGLTHLGVLGMGSDGAVIVTLSVPPERFATIREAVYPYLLTLQPT